MKNGEHETKRIEDDIEREYFVEFAKNNNINEKEAENFWNKNYSYKTSMPKDISDLWKPSATEPGKSWKERRMLQYEREVGITETKDLFLK